jgi:hypothetical protein
VLNDPDPRHHRPPLCCAHVFLIWDQVSCILQRTRSSKAEEAIPDFPVVRKFGYGCRQHLQSYDERTFDIPEPWWDQSTISLSWNCILTVLTGLGLGRGEDSETHARARLHAR